MPNADPFALQRSDLNGFLFADVGTEANGMTLSVVSVFARLGEDPWREAGRLARLPREAAIDGLARIIAAMPASLWSLTDARVIAARLVALLPARGASPTPAPAAQSRASGSRLRALRAPWSLTRWLVVAALCLAAAVGWMASNAVPHQTAPADGGMIPWVAHSPTEPGKSGRVPTAR